MSNQANRQGSVLLKNCPERMIRAYYIAFAVSGVLTVILMLFTHGESFANTLFSDQYVTLGVFGHDDFMDFFNSIRDAGTKEVYKNGIIYPPLANLFFYVLSKMVNPDLVSIRFVMRKLLSHDTTCLTLYAVFVFVCLLAFVRMMQIRLDGAASPGRVRYLPILLIFSYPMIYCIQRGNILLLTMVLTMFFVFYRNDERKWVRELSYIALAVAAGLKLYPAVFGLLMFVDKKYKEAVRLLVYGVLITVLPFFFYDGLESIRDLYENLKEFSTLSANQVNFDFVTSDVIARLLWEWVGVDYIPTRSFIFSANMLGALLMFLIMREEWQRVLCLSYLFMNLGSGGRMYILIFLIIPFALFLKKGSFRRRDVVYFIFFFLLLMYLPCVYYPAFNTVDKMLEAGEKMLDKPNNLIAAVSLQSMMVFMFFDMLKRVAENELLILRFKKKKESASESAANQP